MIIQGHGTDILEYCPELVYQKTQASDQKFRSVVTSTALHLFIGRHSTVGNVPGYRCILTADPGVVSLIPALSHTFMDIDHEII